MKEIDIDELIKQYETRSITDICRDWHVGVKRVKRLLLENGVTLRTHSERNKLAANQQKVKDKIANTKFARYGSATYNNAAKMQKTKLDKYGSATYNNREQATATMLKLYGVPYASKNPIFTEKARQTSILNWGVDNYTKTLEYHKISRKLYSCDNETFDSLPELALWVYAKEHNEEIMRCPYGIPYEYNGKSHMYFPDFIYKGELVEIKGDHFFSEGKLINPYDRSQDDLYEAKHQAGLKAGVKFWGSKEYTKYVNYLKTSSYKYEIRKFND